MLKVKEDRIEEYKRHHKQVWPEMLAAFRKTGWHNYSLFIDENGLLFGYFETLHSLEVAQEAVERTQVNAKWQEMMAPFFEIPPGRRPDGMMVKLEGVLHLN